MALLLHVTIALSSVLLTTYIFITPSKTTLRWSYSLVVMTLASGTYLVVSTGTHILQACLMGLLYCGISLLGLASAHRRLAMAASPSRRKR
jgi:hypothetical protein